MPEITQILQDWNDGNEAAKERLLPFVYDELKRQARFLMSRERPNHTLQATALVHEAFMKLSEQSGVDWKNRSHFYGIASRFMRQILVDHARQHNAEKRGLTNEEIAENLGISERTVGREWQAARLWLYRELNKS